MNDKEREEFINVVTPVIKYLKCKHPHMSILIDSDKAEMKEGIAVITNDELKRRDE